MVLDSIKKRTGCSAVRLAHLLWEQGVPGSNPGTPTLKDKELLIIVTPFLLSKTSIYPFLKEALNTIPKTYSTIYIPRIFVSIR